MQECEGLKESVYQRMPHRLLKGGDRATTVLGIEYFMLVLPKTEVESKVIVTRKT